MNTGTARSAGSALIDAQRSYPERPGITPSAITRSGGVRCASVSPSSAERATDTVTSSEPANVMAKAFWIVTLSSAIRMRLAIERQNYHHHRGGSIRRGCATRALDDRRWRLTRTFLDGRGRDSGA